jgi:type I restriction enzyme S subunit
MKTVALKYLATIISGQSPLSEHVSTLTDGLPFLQGNAEFGTLNPTARLQCSRPTKTAERGDLLLSVRAPVGALNEADQRYGIGRGLVAIRAGRNTNSRYLFWALHACSAALHLRAVGSTFDAVTVDDVATLALPGWPIRQQCGIAAHLNFETSRLDKLALLHTDLERLVDERLSALTDSVLHPHDSWPQLRHKHLLREVVDLSLDGTEELLTVSHLTWNYCS